MWRSRPTHITASPGAASEKPRAANARCGCLAALRGAGRPGLGSALSNEVGNNSFASSATKFLFAPNERHRHALGSISSRTPWKFAGVLWAECPFALLRAWTRGVDARRRSSFVALAAYNVCASSGVWALSALSAAAARRGRRADLTPWAAGCSSAVGGHATCASCCVCCSRLTRGSCCWPSHPRRLLRCGIARGGSGSPSRLLGAELRFQV